MNEVEAASEDEPLLLIGYVEFQPWGWALPCFGSSAASNRVCIARCSIDGDHLGKISAFEEWYSPDVVKLPASLHRPVEIGSPWVDVFLWNGVAHVGDPQTLWNSLSPDIDEITRRAPLSVVDLALEVLEPDQRRALIRQARDWLEAGHGRDQGDYWIRTEAESRVTISLKRAGLDPSSIMFAAVASSRPAIVSASPMPEALRELTSNLGTIAQDWSVLISVGDAKDTSALTGVVAQRAVLVVTAGARSKEIARAARALDWSPIRQDDQFGEPWLMGPLSEAEIVDASVIDIVEFEDMARRGGYRAVVILADDDIIADRRGLAVIADRFRDAVKSGGVMILAPALPKSVPSRLLVAENSWSGLKEFFDLVLDTSVVRSPLRPTRTRLSLDRRIMDHVMTAAALCGGEGSVSLTAAAITGGAEPPVLGFHFEDGARDSVSESHSDVSVEMIAREPIRFADVKNRAEKRVGELTVSRRKADFAHLAHIVLAQMSLTSPRGVVGQDLELPSELRKLLDFPTLCLGFETADGERLCLTGEAPSLDALQGAAKLGVTLIRYSDESGLRRWSDEGLWLSGDFLPDDVRLPEIRRLASNRRIATRGVDPRDALILNREEWEAIRGGRSSFADEVARTYVESPFKKRPERGRVVLPLSALIQSDDGDPVVADLKNRFDPQAVRPKRLEDLVAAWRPTSAGLRRFVLEDGSLPAAPQILPFGFVPAQTFFIIDAAAEVEALLRSSIFQVWARATRSRATGWTPRFAMTGTFETLPIVSPFVTSLGMGSAIILDGSRAAVRLSELYKSSQEVQSPVADDEFDPIELAIRHAYGLDSDAGDLEILDRLIQLNSELSEKES